MPGPCILISSELNLHREAFVGMLLAHRPHLLVHAVAPSDLDTFPAGQEPHLVICNDQMIIQQTQPFAWILMFPDGENLAHIGIGDTRRTLTDASMQELVGVIDEIWSLLALSNE
jgi:hypothetical protein